MLSEYKYIDEEEPKEEIRQAPKVRFKVDYDITEVCMLFGNWSRKNLYLRQNTPSYYYSQPKRLKEVCSDNDAMLINDALLSILSLNISRSKEIYDTLILYYFGEKQEIADYIAIDGYVREEWKRQAQGSHDLPDFKKLAHGIRKDSIYIVKQLSVADIAQRFETNWNAVDKLKKTGEDFLNGYFMSMKMNAGIELQLLKDKYL